MIRPRPTRENRAVVNLVKCGSRGGPARGSSTGLAQLGEDRIERFRPKRVALGGEV